MAIGTRIGPHIRPARRSARHMCSSAVSRVWPPFQTPIMTPTSDSNGPPPRLLPNARGWSFELNSARSIAPSGGPQGISRRPVKPPRKLWGFDSLPAHQPVSWYSIHVHVGADSANLDHDVNRCRRVAQVCGRAEDLMCRLAAATGAQRPPASRRRPGLPVVRAHGSADFEQAGNLSELSNRVGTSHSVGLNYGNPLARHRTIETGTSAPGRCSGCGAPRRKSPQRAPTPD